MINILSVSIPFVVSFDKRIQLFKFWKSLFAAIFLSAIPFLIWDYYFTAKSYWGFNEEYLMGYYILNLPIEEILFFICIPFACIFTHVAILKIKPIRISIISLKIINTVIIVLFAFLFIFNLDKAYTSWVSAFGLIIQILAMFFFKDGLRQFYLTFLFMLIPFLVVNGVLTGSGITNPIVWYNDNQNLEIRAFTIPIEDFAYAYELILLNLLLFNALSSKSIIVSQP